MVTYRLDFKNSPSTGAILKMLQKNGLTPTTEYKIPYLPGKMSHSDNTLLYRQDMVYDTVIDVAFVVGEGYAIKAFFNSKDDREILETTLEPWIHGIIKER